MIINTYMTNLLSSFVSPQFWVMVLNLAVATVFSLGGSSMAFVLLRE